MGLEIEGKQILIMGLGAHGGGAASARFFCEHGASVVVTDLRNETELAPSLQALSDCDIQYRLGTHREDDFRTADVVIKNPAVPRTSPFLRLATRIETDISVFLSIHGGHVFGVTGTKGKSSTASALHHLVHAAHPSARLGGNITISPLSFCRELTGEEIVVLELSSFQLGDLRMTESWTANELTPFTVAVVTNLLPDHQDYYDSMESYAADKAIIFERQPPQGWVVLAGSDPYSAAYAPPHSEHVIRTAGNHGSGDRRFADLLPEKLLVPGTHMRHNLHTAAVAASLYGMDSQAIRAAAASYTGIPHRLELVRTIDNVLYINDSAATIQEATLAAVSSLGRPVHIIAGGSDKGLPLDRFVEIARKAASVTLLHGTATEKIVALFERSSASFSGPHASLRAALEAARQQAQAGDAVLLSPGCASFGMFRNEFDRGDQFRELVKNIY
ncbi:MAG: UDP-N-acetylmuramoyl-L-alanine--D-glutamate ligase [Spirochaetales bacterium]